jgi:drug/metabolite transporter (DMT)-like permease
VESGELEAGSWTVISHRRALVFASLVTVLWSSSWVIIRFGLDDEGMRPLTFAGLRYVLAGVVLLSVAVAGSRTRRILLATRRGELAALVALGIVFIGIAQGAQFVALDNQPAATTSLVIAFTPLLVVAVAGRSLGEWATPRQIAGAALVAAGATLYFSGALEATLVGMVAAVVALLGNTVGSVLGRGVHRSGERSPVVTTGVSMTIGAIALLGFGIAIEGPPTVTGRAALMIGWLAVVNGSLAFWMWNQSLRRLTATESAVINNTMLVQIAALAWLFLAETPSPAQIVGIVAVTVGIIGSQVGGRRSAVAVSPDGPPGAAASDTPRPR